MNKQMIEEKKEKVKTHIKSMVAVMDRETDIVHDWGTYDAYLADLQRSIDRLRLLSAPLPVGQTNQV